MEKVHLERQKEKEFYYGSFYILFLQNFALTEKKLLAFKQTNKVSLKT